jgi:hypothetical protein
MGVGIWSDGEGVVSVELEGLGVGASVGGKVVVVDVVGAQLPQVTGSRRGSWQVPSVSLGL